jgi:thiol-disulfide isomerase/thioredoxin
MHRISSRNFKLKFTCACLLCAAALLFAACGGGNQRGVSSNNQIGSASPAPSPSPRSAFAFTPPKINSPEMRAGTIEKRWTTVGGKTARLSDFGGKVVVLDFYATWCPPCREEIPHLVALNERYAKQGLQIVGLNVGGDDDRLQVPSFAKEYGIKYQLGDPDPQMTDVFFADDDTIPQTFVFDKRGRLLQRFIGYRPTMPDELESLVKNALADDAKELSSKR